MITVTSHLVLDRCSDLSTRLKSGTLGSYDAVLELEHILLSDVFTPDEVTNILSEFDDETRASMSQLYLGFEPVIERSVGSLISSGAIDLQWIIDPQRNNMLPYLNRYYNLVAREQKS